MSQENVEIVRRVWAAVERHDTEAMFAFYDPDIVWQDHTDALELQDHSYHGHEGVRQFWREWLEPFETFEAHSDFVLTRLHGRLKGSEREVQSKAADVWTFREGSAIRFRSYDSRVDALEAVGLSE